MKDKKNTVSNEINKISDINNMAHNLKVLYEDNHIIVVVKPAGVASQADKSGDIDMLTIVKAYIKEKYNKPGDVYLGLVHRLDRMVGGIMIFARTSKAASRLSNYIREHNFKKKYICVVNGNIDIENDENGKAKSYELKNYLVKNERLNMSRICDSTLKNSKEAILIYTPIKSFKLNNKEYTVVNIDLKTGRHHQIRVQMAGINHPLYGDIKYGNKVNKVGENLALWSYYLSCYHPTKDEYLEFECMPNEVTENGLYKRNRIWENV